MRNHEQSRVMKSREIRVCVGHKRLTGLRSASYDCGVRKHSRFFVNLLVVLLASVVLVGCSKGNAWEKPGAKESFETFLMDLWRGNRTEAFEAIWSDDQKRLMAAGDALEKAYPKVPALKPEQWLVVSRIDNPYDIRRLEIVPNAHTSFERGDRVTLEIHYYDDRVGKTEMVWGGERWYVALPEPTETVKPAVDAVDAVDSGSEVDDEALQLPDEEVSIGND